MKKFKLILVMFAFVLVLTGCTKEDGKIDYNAIYKLGDAKIKLYLKGENVYYKIDSDDINVSGNAELKNNKIVLDMVSENTTAKFKEGKIELKTDYEYLKGGNYKNVGAYTKEEFYNDFYGDIKYLNSEINGIYLKDDIKMYVYELNQDAIRLVYDFDDMGHDLEISKTDDGDYNLEFFEDTYTIKFTSNDMIIDLKTEEEAKKKISGTYKKDANLDLDTIIDNLETH